MDNKKLISTNINPFQPSAALLSTLKTSEKPHEKINQCLTDINECLTDIFKIQPILTNV